LRDCVKTPILKKLNLQFVIDSDSLVFTQAAGH